MKSQPRFLPNANEHMGKHHTCTEADSLYMTTPPGASTDSTIPAHRQKAKRSQKTQQSFFSLQQMKTQENDPHTRTGCATPLCEGMKNVEFEGKKRD